MGNTHSEQHESSDATPTFDVERGGHVNPQLPNNLHAHLECPEEAFVRIGLAGPAHRRPSLVGAEKKRTTLGSSLKRLLSGKARRKATPPLPMTSDDVTHRTADARAAIPYF